MLGDLHTLLQPSRPLHVVDIGANPIEGDPPYKPLLAAGLCRVTGFEPQVEALAKLNAAKSIHETYLPYAVGDGTAKTLNLCAYSGFTSTLKPNEASLDIFAVFKSGAQVVGQSPVQTKRLDDIAEIHDIDFLKIDIQGGELDVFRNGARALSTTAMIQTEVSFVNLYDAQPSFGEIDIELRRQGFMPHSFAALKKAIIAPFTVNNNPGHPLNQLLEADAVYVRDFREPAALSDKQLKYICLVAHACYGSYDLAHRCILMLQERNGLPPNAAEQYLALLNTRQGPSGPA